MSILSKLLCEIEIVENVNDKVDADKATPDGPYTVTLTAGRYRDVIALAAELQTQLEALAWGTWTVSVADLTGIVTISCDASFTVDWTVASTYGSELRDALGFDGTETGTTSLVSSAQHAAGFYPSEPVELDDRPKTTGSDRWSADSYQQQGRTGRLANKGGTVKVYSRSVTVLLPQGDLEAFSAFMGELAQGKSFAFYHDAEQAWDGPAGEYAEYQLVVGDNGAEYAPEPVDETNTLWHRSTLRLQRRVAPST